MYTEEEQNKYAFCNIEILFKTYRKLNIPANWGQSLAQLTLGIY